MLRNLTNKINPYWPILSIVLILIYYPSLNGPFILDDAYTIRHNPSIQSWSNIFNILFSAKAYTSLPMTWTYRPVTSFSNLLMWSLGDGAPWPFHLFKIFLFVPLCYFITKTLQELLPEASKRVIYSLIFLFAINPVNSQVLGYISATSTLLAAFFVYLSLFLKIRFDQSGNKAFLIISLFSSFLAMMAKEEGIVVIAFLIIYDLFKHKKISKPTFYHILPIAIASFMLFLNFEPASTTARSVVGPMEYFATQTRAYLRYIAMFFYSYDLNADNFSFGFSKSLSDKPVILALVVNGLILLTAYFSKKAFPIITVGTLWFYAGISPASSFVPLGEAVNDHRAFIGYGGLLILSCYFLVKVETRSKLAFKLLFIFLIPFYAYQTYQRAQLWGDGIKLWSDTVSKNPTSSRALNNLATHYMQNDDLQSAQTYLNKCVSFADPYPFCHINLGLTYARLGKDLLAEKNLEAALSSDFSYISSRLIYANFLSERGFYTRANTLLEEADQFSGGNHYETKLKLIFNHMKHGHHQRALKATHQTIETFGNKPEVTQIMQRLSSR